jgi:hypothetical protein
MTATHRNPLERVDRTTDCPPDEVCLGCKGGESLDVAAVLTPGGVCCLTVCESCVVACRMPVLDEDEAARRVLAHCAHLGITADEMTAAMAEARR